MFERNSSCTLVFLFVALFCLRMPASGIDLCDFCTEVPIEPDNCLRIVASYALLSHRNWDNIYIFRIVQEDNRLQIDFFDQSLNNYLVNFPYKRDECGSLYNNKVSNFIEGRTLSLVKTNCSGETRIKLPINIDSFKEIKDIDLSSPIQKNLGTSLRRRDSKNLTFNVPERSRLKNTVSLDVLIDNKTGKIKDCFGIDHSSMTLSKSDYIWIIYYLRELEFSVESQKDVRTSIILKFE
jgi:hypothetical protein